jgi:hypothetical protein
MEKRRVGRPKAKSKDGEKATVSIRMAPALKESLNRASDVNDRSLSQEAELRLERSFRNESLLVDVMETAYGRTLAGLLMVMGRVLQDAGPSIGFLVSRTPDGASRWLENPFAYDQGCHAIHAVLEAFRPEGEIIAPPMPTDLPIEEFGRGFAAGILRAIADRESGGELGDWAAKVRPLLGSLADPPKGSGAQ